MATAFASIVALWMIGVFPALALLGLVPALLAYRAGTIVMERYSQFKELLPAQLMTIQTQLLVGCMLIVGLVASGLL